MILIGNVQYSVMVQMPSGVWHKFRLTYCGGSLVDSNGHHVADGVWSLCGKSFVFDATPFIRVGLLPNINRPHYIVPGSGVTEWGGTYDDAGKCIGTLTRDQRFTSWLEAHDRNLRRYLTRRSSATTIVGGVYMRGNQPIGYVSSDL